MRSLKNCPLLSGPAGSGEIPMYERAATCPNRRSDPLVAELMQALDLLTDPLKDRYSCQAPGKNQCRCGSCADALARAALAKAKGETR